MEKYNVFAYASEIARIVRAASQEEQLDFMIADLRTTWTEQKMSIKMCHGIATVTDFSQLHTTVSASIVTLKARVLRMHGKFLHKTVMRIFSMPNLCYQTY